MQGEVKRGVALGIGLNVLCVALYLAGLSRGPNEYGFSLKGLFLLSVVTIGVMQWIYIFPVIWYFYHNQRPGVVKGLVIALVLTALPSGIFWMVITW